MFVCLSPGGQSLTQGETAKDKLLVGTVDGIFAFQKRDGSWQGDGTMVPGKHFSSIIFEPTTKTLFGGTYSGEIYASSDLGKTWERRDTGIGDKEIYSLATQVVNGKPRIYAGTQPAHLYYSDDLGKSWTELPGVRQVPGVEKWTFPGPRSEEHTSELQSRLHLVCRLLLEKKKKTQLVPSNGSTSVTNTPSPPFSPSSRHVLPQAVLPEPAYWLQNSCTQPAMQVAATVYFA